MSCARATQSPKGEAPLVVVEKRFKGECGDKGRGAGARRDGKVAHSLLNQLVDESRHRATSISHCAKFVFPISFLDF